jgi:1-aminocyclopropane-1-carboxylate deaminase/D-cysteine desulfhydrase-like pyridoxal-dependent ACC family enzyme
LSHQEAEQNGTLIPSNLKKKPSKIRENIMFLTKNTAKTRGVKTSSELRIAVGQWQFCENYGPVVMEMANLVSRAMPVRGLARAQALLWVIVLKVYFR